MGYKAKEGQDIFDLSLQFYGSVEAGLMSLITGNGLSADGSNLFGREITLNNPDTADKKVVNYFNNNNFIPSNSGFEVVGGLLGDFNDDYSDDFFN